MISKGGISLFLACLLCTLPAYSTESLRFKSEHLPSDLLKSVALHANVDNWNTSNIDLNNDGIEEKILKSDDRACTKTQGCQHVIAAQKGTNWILLGDVKAFNILVSDKRTYGIRDLLVYSTPNNDFSFERYVWNPRAFKYEEQ